MLDDCRGEKFDELLAVFSTNVLRGRKVQDRNLVTELSLAPGLTPQEYPLLLPLILAHRVSLNTLGARRARVRDTHGKFWQLLDKKKDELGTRSTPGTHVTTQNQGADLETLAREIKANWQGSVEFADTLLYGGLNSGRDAFLELPFDSAWSQAKKSTVDDLRTTSSRPDLVLDLETRILRQKARLQRWHQYSASLRNSDTASPLKHTDSKKPPQLAFRDHQNLTIASISRSVRQPVDRRTPATSDQDLLDYISEAVDRINGPSPQQQIPSESISESKPDPEQKPSRQIPSITQPEIFEPPVDSTEIESTKERPSEERPRGSHTLMERTRKSMSLYDALPEIPPPAEPTPEKLPREPTPEEQYREPTPEGEPRDSFTLAERTRKSMSLLPPPREKPHPSRRRSRKSRVSFPVNQFETPPKADFPSRASTPRDELFEDQADYASVFKSRPRIALSPITSPAVHVSPIGDFDLSADVESEDGADDLEYAEVGSPSAARGSGRY